MATVRRFISCFVRNQSQRSASNTKGHTPQRIPKRVSRQYSSLQWRLLGLFSLVPIKSVMGYCSWKMVHTRYCAFKWFFPSHCLIVVHRKIPETSKILHFNRGSSSHRPSKSPAEKRFPAKLVWQLGSNERYEAAIWIITLDPPFD